MKKPEGKLRFETASVNVYLKEKQIVSKKFARDVKSFFEEDLEVLLSSGIETTAISHLGSNIAGFLNDLRESNIIDQWDVVFDNRNNTDEDIKEGRVNLYVKFRQWNCLNTTSLEYHMVAKPKAKSKKVLKKRGRYVI